MKEYMVIDIGGTHIKYSLMNENYEFIVKGEEKTPHTDLDTFIQTLRKIIEPARSNISGIAISAPGRINADTGFMYTAGALQSFLGGTDLAAKIQEFIDVPVTVENDAKCAALAELAKGSLQGIKHGLVITIGTGLGGGIIANGQVLRGFNFSSGEISNVPTSIKPQNDPIKAWAHINSSLILNRKYAVIKDLDPNAVTGHQFFEAVHAGDEQALAILDEYTTDFARGIFAVQVVLDSQRVCLGGGISAQDVLIDKIREKVHKIFDNPGSPVMEPEIMRCAFGNDANLIGALHHHLIK